MKTRYWLNILFACSVVPIQAQVGPQLFSGTVQTSVTPYRTVDWGQNHTTWERYRVETNRSGRVIVHTNRYVELETGKRYWQDGQWLESSEQIQIVPNGAVATNGPHKVAFAANINSPVSVQILTPDSKAVKIRPLGLAYYDFHLRTNILIAELKDSGGLLVSSNQVLYPDAFTDFKADVRYTYRKSGFEQDVILRQRPPLPEAYGLNPATTWFLIVTEFIDPPADVQVTHQIRRGWKKSTVDKVVDFGKMKIGQGRAFSLDQEPDRHRGVPVLKHWTIIDGRTFLIEEVSFPQLVPYLRSLQAAKESTSNGVLLALHKPSPKLLLPPIPRARPSRRDQIEIAAAPPAHAGVVVDYGDDVSMDVTFQGDTTYSIVGPIYLAGDSTFEGGTVIKYAAGASINVLGGFVRCLTGPYRPAIFTAVDDDSVGGTIYGSSGNPQSGAYASPALDVSGADSGDLKYLNIRYASEALSCINNSFSLRDSQIVFSHYGIRCDWGNFTNYNVLMSHVDYPYFGSLFAGQVEHLTCDQAVVLAGNSEEPGSDFWCELGGTTNHGVLNLTNCITCAITNGYGTMAVTTDHVQDFPTGAGIFQTVGAGSYYLVDGSTNRDAGTTNIDLALLAELRQKTTHPPILYSNITLSADTTLSPQAQRDTDIPDLGYHYDPIDYLCSCCISNATLTLTNGVAVGYFNYIGLWLHNGSSLVSCGTPLQRNYLVHYNLVQEQPLNLALTTYSGFHGAVPINPYHTDTSRNPSIALRFTTFMVPLGANNVVNTLDGGWEVNAFDMRDCEVFGAAAGWSQSYYSAAPAITLRNNLFQYTSIDVETAGALSAFNNLFSATTNYWTWFANWGTATFTNTDNAFDGCQLYLEGTIAENNNAYLNGAMLWSGDPQSSDIITNLTWVSGPLGNYYQPTNSPLIDKGSRTADLAGLYHYTTQVNQLQETNSIVDIGYHYVAVDGSGNPFDSDGDGVPDYLEDANGNGRVDSGETDWQSASDLGLKVLITRPKNNSLVP